MRYMLFNNPEQAENLKRHVVVILRNKNGITTCSGLSNAYNMQRDSVGVTDELSRGKASARSRAEWTDVHEH
ncbi:hypothetical protein ABW286_14265, partial [Erwinia papayae]